MSPNKWLGKMTWTVDVHDAYILVVQVHCPPIGTAKLSKLIVPLQIVDLNGLPLVDACFQLKWAVPCKVGALRCAEKWNVVGCNTLSTQTSMSLGHLECLTSLRGDLEK